MAKLSKIEKFYIDNNPELSDSQIAKDLDTEVVLVENHRKKSKRKEAATIQKSADGLELFAKKKTKDGKPMTVVMTEAASQVGDDSKYNNLTPKDTSGYIAKIRNE